MAMTHADGPVAGADLATGASTAQLGIDLGDAPARTREQIKRDQTQYQLDLATAYSKDHPESAAFRAVVNRAETSLEQIRLTRGYFDQLGDRFAGQPRIAA